MARNRNTGLSLPAISLAAAEVFELTLKLNYYFSNSNCLMIFLDKVEFKPYLEREKGPKDERKSHFYAYQMFHSFNTRFYVMNRF